MSQIEIITTTGAAVSGTVPVADGAGGYNWQTVSGVGTSAPLASPQFTGNPTAPTPSAGDDDTSIATTAFVTNAISAAGGGGGVSKGYAIAMSVALG